MIRFLTDENFDGRIRKVLSLRPHLIDIVRIQDIGLMSAKDPDVLQWAADQGRIVLTHDIRTMPGFAYARVRLGLRMAGVICVPERMGVGAAIADLMTLVIYETVEDFEGQVKFLPL